MEIGKRNAQIGWERYATRSCACFVFGDSLNANGQNVDHQDYEWGRVDFVDGEEPRVGAGIRIRFNKERSL
jgi:hypothetical protein